MKHATIHPEYRLFAKKKKKKKKEASKKTDFISLLQNEFS